MMPKVKGCSVNDCFYNENKQCHAEAINVGAGHPTCNTYLRAESHIGVPGTGVVGACREEHCRYNIDFLCTAPNVRVGYHEAHADCQTFCRQ
jgi:hypothetical protein